MIKFEVIDISSTSLFIKAAEIAEVMGKSKSYGYKVVRKLNKVLSEFIIAVY